MSDTRSYGRGARVLSAGIATTGLVTFAFFSLANHALTDAEYGGITLLWASLFLIISIIYRPVEQLLSRTISIRRARGEQSGRSLRTAVTIQLGFAAFFLTVALALRETIRDQVFGGSEALYWVLVGAVLAYAASYFARGWLAGHGKFALYGGLVLLEACSRVLFALAAVIGIATGQSVVALGIVAAPLVSLVVVPWALNRRKPAPAAAPARTASDLSLREGGAFAGAVVAIMAAEQALLNVPVLIVWAANGAVWAGYAFTVLLITRAPLQLFQAIQTTLLPHLSGLAATQGEQGFRHALKLTLLSVAGFTAAVVAALALIGPWAMDLLFPSASGYPRDALVLVGFGMGFHLAAGTLNQAALARGRSTAAAGAWLACALLFVAWLVASPVSDPVLAVAAGYCATTALLALALWRIEATAGVRPATHAGEPVAGGVSVTRS